MNSADQSRSCRPFSFCAPEPPSASVAASSVRASLPSSGAASSVRASLPSSGAASSARASLPPSGAVSFPRASLPSSVTASVRASPARAFSARTSSGFAPSACARPSCTCSASPPSSSDSLKKVSSSPTSPNVSIALSSASSSGIPCPANSKYRWYRFSLTSSIISVLVSLSFAGANWFVTIMIIFVSIRFIIHLHCKQCI